jgi:hypothetical protein
MTLRKRRTPSPGFRLPPPYQPITGEQAKLIGPGDFPYCAMMQVAAADTHADYLICRGYDPRIRKFFDYEVGDEDKKGIPVAKPYGKRQTRLGQNSGVAATSQGHPADLEEEVEILYTDDEKVITWLLLDAAGGNDLVRFELIDDMTLGECSRAFIRHFVDDDPEEACGYWETDTETIIWVQDPARKLCGWGGWELVEDVWTRPSWAGDGGTPEVFDESNCGSIGTAYLPSDATPTTGTPEVSVHEILWMVEPCEMFYAEVEDGVIGTGETIPLLAGSHVPMNTSRNRRFWQNTPPSTVDNVFHWYISATAFIICARKNCHDYYPIQVSCPPIFEPPV